MDIAMVRDHEDDHEFTTMDRAQLKRRDWAGMLIVDSAGRSFQMVGAEPIRRTNGFLSRLVIGPFYEIRPVLVEAPPIPFEELVERTCISVEDEPGLWLDSEVVAGESGEPRDPEDLMKALLARLRNARSVPELVEVMITAYETA